MRQRKTFVIADLHFGHANVMKYSPSRMKVIDYVVEQINFTPLCISKYLSKY